MKKLIEKVKFIANSWGEELEPPVLEVELQNFSAKLQKNYSITIPLQYAMFLQIVDGLEFNGLIIYGTKKSIMDPYSSSLDFFEMNNVFQGELRDRGYDIIIIGEDSTGLLSFDNKMNQFQYRDRIGLDRVESFTSFEQMLKEEIEKVI